MASKDPRPVCNCPAYGFPHRATSKKCSGREFTLYYFTFVRELCNECNCNNEAAHKCDVAEGIESLKEAECYQEELRLNPGGTLPIEPNFEQEFNE